VGRIERWNRKASCWKMDRTFKV